MSLLGGGGGGSKARVTMSFYMTFFYFEGVPKLNMSIFRDIFGVFSAQDAWIKLIPFALYQASQDTCVEYPHEVV